MGLFSKVGGLFKSVGSFVGGVGSKIGKQLGEVTKEAVISQGQEVYGSLPPGAQQEIKSSALRIAGIEIDQKMLLIGGGILLFLLLRRK